MAPNGSRPGRGGVGRKEPVEERGGIDGRAARERLGQVGQADEQQQHERDGREERVEGERAREKRQVVFVGGLQSPADEAGGRAMPPAGSDAAQASGSSGSPPTRRRARDSARRRSSSSRAEGADPRPRAGGTSRLARLEQLLVVPVVVLELAERVLGAAELLRQLVELLLGHGPQLPQPPLQHPPGLLAAPRGVHQRHAGAEHHAPEEPLRGGVSPLDVDDFPALVAHGVPLIPRRRGHRPPPPAPASTPRDAGEGPARSD